MVYEKKGEIGLEGKSVGGSVNRKKNGFGRRFSEPKKKGGGL